jgi:Holliday junction resolvasome RuvABC DNA-binding subunit
VRNATVDDLCRVPGISKNLAQSIVHQLRQT